MTANEFLYTEIVLTVIGLCIFRRLFRQRWLALIRVCLFMAAASFSFDYIANNRRIWEFTGAWNLHVLINPFENTIFTTTMTVLLLLLYLGLESRTPRKDR